MLNYKELEEFGGEEKEGKQEKQKNLQEKQLSQEDIKTKLAEVETIINALNGTDTSSLLDSSKEVKSDDEKKKLELKEVNEKIKTRKELSQKLQEIVMNLNNLAKKNNEKTERLEARKQELQSQLLSPFKNFILTNLRNSGITWEEIKKYSESYNDERVLDDVLKQLLNYKNEKLYKQRVAQAILANSKMEVSQLKTDSNDVIYSAINYLISRFDSDFTLSKTNNGEDKVAHNKSIKPEHKKNLSFAISNAFEEYRSTTGENRKTTVDLTVLTGSIFFLTGFPLPWLALQTAYLFFNIRNNKKSQFISFSTTFPLRNLFEGLSGGENDFHALKLIIIKHVLGSIEFARLASSNDWHPQKTYQAFMANYIDDYKISSADNWQIIYEVIQKNIKNEEWIKDIIKKAANQNTEKSILKKSSRLLCPNQDIPIKTRLMVYFLLKPTMKDESAQNVLTVRNFFDEELDKNNNDTSFISIFMKRKPHEKVSFFISLLLRDELLAQWRTIQDSFHHKPAQIYDTFMNHDTREANKKIAKEIMTKLIKTWFESLKLNNDSKVKLSIDKEDISNKIDELVNNMSQKVMFSAIHELASRIVHPELFATNENSSSMTNAMRLT